MPNASNKSRPLTASQRLAVAQSLMGRQHSFPGVLRGLKGKLLVRVPRRIANPTVDLRSLARGPFEKAVAQIWSRYPPPELLKLEDPNARRFLFRCYLVPEFAAVEIRVGRYLDPSSTEKLPPWWLYEPATYLLASERMSLEGFLRRAKNGKVEFDGETWKVPQRPQKNANLPERTLDWLLDDSLDVVQMEERFDQWRGAEMQSFKYYMAANSSDIAKHAGVRSDAALLGAIQRLTPFPEGIVGYVIAHMRKLRKECEQTFYASAAKSPKNTRLKDVALDTWLIEVHPLTYRYSWQFHTLLEVARLKFKSRTGALTSPDHLRSHMRRLNLKLAPDAGKAGMRFGKDGAPKPGFLTPTGWLATFIEAIAPQARRWLLGQLGRVPK